jgi:hypothetical protein
MPATIPTIWAVESPSFFFGLSSDLPSDDESGFFEAVISNPSLEKRSPVMKIAPVAGL